jgi:hypothetical protein
MDNLDEHKVQVNLYLPLSEAMMLDAIVAVKKMKRPKVIGQFIRRSYTALVNAGTIVVAPTLAAVEQGGVE